MEKVNGNPPFTMFSTLNPELDRRLGGGIPRASLIMIYGVNGSGKSVLAQQIAWGALQSNLTVRYISTETTIRALLRSMERLGFENISDYFLKGKFRVNTLHSKSIKWNRKVAKQLMSCLTYFIERLDNCDVIIIDSLTPIAIHSNESDIVEFFSCCRKVADETCKTTVITIHPGILTSVVFTRLLSIADGVIELKIVVSSRKLLRVMKILKMSGREFIGESIAAFEVEPHRGIKVLPLSYAKA